MLLGTTGYSVFEMYYDIHILNTQSRRESADDFYWHLSTVLYWYWFSLSIPCLLFVCMSRVNCAKLYPGSTSGLLRLTGILGENSIYYTVFDLPKNDTTKVLIGLSIAKLVAVGLNAILRVLQMRSFKPWTSGGEDGTWKRTHEEFGDNNYEDVICGSVMTVLCGSQTVGFFSYLTNDTRGIEAALIMSLIIAIVVAIPILIGIAWLVKKFLTYCFSLCEGACYDLKICCKYKCCSCCVSESEDAATQMY
jgi:hypothetical protein